MFKRFQPLFAAMIAMCVVVCSAQAIDADRQSELRRHADNDARIARMYTWAQPKVRAVLSDMESHGYRPLIDAQVYRSAAQQAVLKKRGVSSVGYSFHMVSDRDKNGNLRPASLAADIVDKRWGWNSGSEFWLKLASSAQAHEMETGIRWGLSTSERAQIDSILKLRLFKAKYKRGWDAAHVQPPARMVTLGEAKRGKRPPVIRPGSRK